MDTQKLILLGSELKAQLQLIEAIDMKLVQRAEGLTSDDIIRLESIAYQIHNLYSACEDLLKLVASYFENNITDNQQWHTALLKRMTLDIPGIRPALISSETFLLLNSLRGFRHFFRHAYGTNIEYEQLKLNLDKSRKVFAHLQKDIQEFIQYFQ
ncbi:MAG: hypothetical protein N5P05_001166 [Chroococcopsis gigantea SAG 12.99]|jgi:hypothetical protein|nr:hypothetical protein [Chroococcopsis gigantea SAG 12.99]